MVYNFPIASVPAQISNCNLPDPNAYPMKGGYANCFTFPVGTMQGITKVSGTVRTGTPICSYDYPGIICDPSCHWYGNRFPAPCGESNGSAPVIPPEVKLYLYVSYVQNPGYYDWSYEGGRGLANPIINVGYNWTFDLITDLGPLNIAGPVYWMKIILSDDFGYCGTVQMFELDGNIVYTGGTPPPGPICTTTCCEGDTRTLTCPIGIGTYDQNCLCPGGNCQWWDASGKNCPVCWPGDQSGCQTCWDGSTVCSSYCDNGQWYPTGLTCPACNCTEGTLRTPVLCSDGKTTIYTEVCHNCGWVASNQACPVCGCVEGQLDMSRPETCCDGRVNYPYVCRSCQYVYENTVPCPTPSCTGTNYCDAGTLCWDMKTRIHKSRCDGCKCVPIVENCPPKPVKGTLNIVGTCPDGSPMYEKWNGSQWVAVACPKPKRR